MSTILKALRRLEQEQRPADRPLREQVASSGAAEGAEAGALRRWPILVGGIGAGVVAGAAVLLLAFAGGGGSLPQAAEPAPAIAVAPGPAPIAAPVAPPASAPAPLASDDVEVLDRGLPEPRIAPEPAEVAAPEPEARAAPKPGSVRPFVHSEPRARAAAAPPAAAFPDLRVERTTWHPLAERRVAVVLVPGEGARELREGDRVAGASVARIEPSGVVFRFEGREVRRKVGGS